MITFFRRNKTKIIELFILFFVVVIFRLPGFFLSHYNNDELIHLSLAMKIDKYSMNVFNRQKYNLFNVERGANPKSQLIGLMEGDRDIGSLLEGFLWEREKLSHHPPALPFFLSMTHKMFAGNDNIYLVNGSKNIYLMFKNAAFQFYACIIPFLFSLFLIFSVYLLGGLFFSHRIGLISAFFLSLTPTELITANKIWADDMTAFWVVLSIIFYLYSLKNNKPIFSLFSGLSCGLSIMTKMSGIYIVILILFHHFLGHMNKKVTINNLINFLFDRKMLYFISGVFITSGWWFNLYYTYFGFGSNKLYFGINEKLEVVKTWNSYFERASKRPWFSYFVLVPYQFPLYLLSYIFMAAFIFGNKIKQLKDFIKESEIQYFKFIILWVLVVFVFLALKPGKELRYMLIAYPAISILAVSCLQMFYEWLKKNIRMDLFLIRLFFISSIGLSLVYSLKIALPAVLFRADIIPIPF